MNYPYQPADRALVLRYLGAAGWTPDAATAALLEEAERLVAARATPRGLWKLLPEPTPGLDWSRAGQDIVRHLAGCEGVVGLAATMGAGVDALLRTLEVSDIALCAVADATASAAIERLCDAVEADARAWAAARGRWLTGRFSPGYGDCPLALQPAFCRALDTVRGIGLAPTRDNLLSPRKSVTAILGLADHPVTGTRAGCARCLLRDKCAYRKRGMTCES